MGAEKGDRGLVTSANAGPGRGPGLRHSCWGYQCGRVQRWELPAATGQETRVMGNRRLAS